MWIEMVVRSGFGVVEIQALKHLIALLDLVVRDDSLVHTALFGLQQRTVFL